MGMFDDVKYETPCPYCGAALEWFQSKDGDCVMATLEPKDVRNFYTACDGCGKWVEYDVIPTAYEIRLRKSVDP